jgi:phage tail sheath protein FI
MSPGGYGTFYFPNIVIRDPLSGELTVAPVSGHIAGIWARTDATRGVHKAPANEPVRGALNLTYNLTAEEQAELNQNGVNCIRFFSREGILVWGARTLAPASSEWRYLSVRRLFNMIEESIEQSTRWIVFEPNDRTLWKSIRRDVGAFLTRIWRDGALMGRTPEEAFFVLCDEETNPMEIIDAGQVVTIIGIAPVKPAEFIIFRISQSSGGTEIQEQGGGSNG